MQDSLRRLAFQNSLQPNIITKLNRSIVMANTAACQLLGYTEAELKRKSLTDIFDKKDKAFDQLLKHRKKEGNARAQLSAIHKKGLKIVCDVTSAIFTNDDGEPMAITTLTDMSQQIQAQNHIDIENKKLVASNIVLAKTRQLKKDIAKDKIVADNIEIAKSKQKRIDVKKEKEVAHNIVVALEKSEIELAKNNEWIRYIAKTSYDVMWDWDIATGNIYVGDSLSETFGYEAANNNILFTDFVACLLPKDKLEVQRKIKRCLASKQNSWSDAFMLKRFDGSLAASTSRASVVRNEAGKAIRLIGATQDISRLHEVENELEKHLHTRQHHKDIFRLSSGLSYDGIWEWNIDSNTFYLDAGFEKKFGYSIHKRRKATQDWQQFLHPDDKATVKKSILEVMTNGSMQWDAAFRFVRADGSIANVYGRAGLIRNKEGKACRMLGVIHDLSRQTAQQELEAQEIRLKEQQISDAILDAKEAERSEIGKELHDNVNQLLGASKLYLEMARTGGENSQMYLSRSSEYTLAAIEEIRKLTKGLATDIIKSLGLIIAIENICRDTMEVSGLKITSQTRTFKETKFNEKFKHNVFRIFQEHLNNIVKHARAQRVNISLSQNKKQVLLTISDNGIGFNTTELKKGIGISNIKSRVVNFNGKVEIISEPGKGCVLSIKFPLSELTSES